MRIVERCRFQAGATTKIRIALLENESPMEIPQGANLVCTIYNRLRQPIFEASVTNLVLKVTGYYVAECIIPAEVSASWKDEVYFFLKMNTSDGFINVARPLTFEILPLP